MNNFSGDFFDESKKYKHVFFDVDNTLTRSRTLITDSMKSALVALSSVADVIIVSGANEEQIWKQITKDFLGNIYVLAQNGNSAISKNSEILWKNSLSGVQKQEIFAHIDNLRNVFPELSKNVDAEDQIQDRGCQVSFSCIGHNADLVRKEAFDPRGDRRQEMLRKVPFESKNLEVKIGGTTCFDYFELGRNKGYNIRCLFNKLNWKSDDALYFGDALFPGGNDSSVVGVCDTWSVENPQQTLAVIRKMI